MGMNRAVKILSNTKTLIFLFAVFLVVIFMFHMKEVVLTARMKAATQQAAVAQITLATKFDINGSYACQEASTSAVLSKKRFFKEDKTATGSSYLLFDGDCMYGWKQIKGKMQPGEKSCGYGKFTGIIDTLSKTGMLKLDTILNGTANNKLIDSILPASQSAMFEEGRKLLSGAFVRSCRPVDNVPDKIFRVPSNVRFAEKKT